jgi:hypothetical protein
MRLLSRSECALRSASPLSDAAVARSEILLDGRATGLIVEGCVLEAAIRWRDCVLAFLTDDIPHEDALRIYLLDAPPAGRPCIADSAWIGAMYSTGAFRQLALREPDAVSFHFIGGTAWTLKLLAQETLSLPFFGEPKGVHRPFGLHRRFSLRADPQTEPRR